MSRQRSPEKLKIEAVKQVTEKGKSVADDARPPGMALHSFYDWINVYSKPKRQRQQCDDQLDRRARHLKKSAAYLIEECG